MQTLIYAEGHLHANLARDRPNAGRTYSAGSESSKSPTYFIYLGSLCVIIMASKISLLSFSAVLTATIACSCIPLPPFRKALEEYRNSTAPYAVATAIDEHKPTGFYGIVNYTILAEGCDTTVVATSPGGGASCGVSLRLNEPYVMRLKLDGNATNVDLCEVIRLYDSLSETDRAFVDNNISSRCTPTSCESCPMGSICRNSECISE